MNDSAQILDIDRLAALQDIDRRLKDRRDRMTALAGEADGFELELGRKRQTVVTLTAERDSLELRRVEMDRQLELSGVKIRDNRMRMNRIRNATELLALQREIELSKEANSQTEEELIRVMETLEVLAAQLDGGAGGVADDRIAGRRDGRRARAPRPPPSGRRSRPRSARATSSPPAWIRNCAASTRRSSIGAAATRWSRRSTASAPAAACASRRSSTTSC